ncbi:phosphopantetheine-binding protein [Vibrio caribbeanicus]|jgi:acyl carrier protein|uniref:Phosphopantetheine-binding protein n=1 Tax=Vibrio caribbeanicus ATCC BAA-2122 TaxID=796620 RepID=E3BMB3_9VIBR|nr:phosphopantetheine-binding protein [Vibrio caribbeanicus]EFP95825.1 phosphopantetheine-binding protein [Vibrio caribbeanicus ATCC BAA-2122]
MLNDEKKIQNNIEEKINLIWKSILNVKNISNDENFFDAGGNSLLMSKVHREIKKQLDIPVSIIDLFQCPTITTLSKKIYQKHLNQSKA